MSGRLSSLHLRHQENSARALLKLSHSSIYLGLAIQPLLPTYQSAHLHHYLNQVQASKPVTANLRASIVALKAVLSMFGLQGLFQAKVPPTLCPPPPHPLLDSQGYPRSHTSSNEH